MNPQIIEKDAIKLVGMVFYGDPFHKGEGWTGQNEIGRLWQRFDSYWEGHKELFQAVVNPDVGYEVHIGTEEYEETKAYYVMVGVEVRSFKGMPPVTFGKRLPASTYARFTLEGDAITSNWSEAIYQQWLPASDYEEAYPFTIERYDAARFKGPGDPESELEILVPITLKKARGTDGIA